MFTASMEMTGPVHSTLESVTMAHPTIAQMAAWILESWACMNLEAPRPDQKDASLPCWISAVHLRSNYISLATMLDWLGHGLDSLGRAFGISLRSERRLRKVPFPLSSR
jgi:hypothetical protein